jgi:aspartate dehydrogenase
MKLGLIGPGAIARHLLAALDDGGLQGVTVPAVLVHREPEARLGSREITNNAARFLRHRFDAVLECAGHDAVRHHAERVLASGADLLVTSVGAFVDDDLFARVRRAAEAAGRRLILPSAGIGALDIVSAAAVGGLNEFVVTVRKDAASWRGTIAAESHDLDRLAGPVVLYDGPVREGARRYPQNVNIAAAVALSGIGLDRTRLVIIADPTIAAHQVEIAARGGLRQLPFRRGCHPERREPEDRPPRRHGAGQDGAPASLRAGRRGLDDSHSIRRDRRCRHSVLIAGSAAPRDLRSSVIWLRTSSAPASSGWAIGGFAPPPG